MKKRLLIAALAAVIGLSLVGCQTSIRSLTVTDPNQADLYRNDERVCQALEGLRKADPFVEMKEVEKLEKKTLESDDEADTVVYGYYDAGKLVYKTYEGYGEDTFVYFPDGEDGASLMCQDEDGKRYSVWYTLRDEEGSVTVSTVGDMNRKYAYGSQELEVVLTPADGNRIWTNYRVNTSKKTAYISYARYRDADGDWYDYCGEVGEGEKPFSEAKFLHLPGDHPANIAGETDLPAELAKTDGIDVQLLLGSGHRFYWAEGQDGAMQWYLEAPVSLVFPDKDARDAFWRRHPSGSAETVEDRSGEQELYLWNQTAILLISEIDPSEMLEEFLQGEFNDPVYYAVTLNEDGSIAKMATGTTLFAS